MSKGGGEAGTTQTIQKADPWSGIQSYLLGAPAVAARPAGYIPGTSSYATPTPHPGRGADELEQWIYSGGATGMPTGSPGMYDPGSAGSPAIKGLYPSAAEWFSNPNSTTAGFDPLQMQTQENIIARARAGSPNLKNAQGLNADILAGKYLTSNPYLDAVFGKASDSVSRQFSNTVMPQLASMYSTAGRYGSGSMTTATGEANRNLGETLSGMGTDIYAGNYQKERDRQMTAMGLAPSLAAADYTDLNALMDVGNIRQGQTQAQLDDPLKKLQAYAALLQGGIGAGGTTTSNASGTTAPGNKMASAIGGGLMGYQAAPAIASMFSGAGGAAAGAAAGGAAGGAATGAALGPWGALAGLALGALM